MPGLGRYLVLRGQREGERHTDQDLRNTSRRAGKQVLGRLDGGGGARLGFGGCSHGEDGNERTSATVVLFCSAVCP